MTQEQLAASAGIPVGSLRNQEQGHRLPSFPTAVALARALGVSCDVLADTDEVNAKVSGSKRPAGPKPAGAKKARGRGKGD